MPGRLPQGADENGVIFGKRYDPDLEAAKRATYMAGGRAALSCPGTAFGEIDRRHQAAPEDRGDAISTALVEQYREQGGRVDDAQASPQSAARSARKWSTE